MKSKVINAITGLIIGILSLWFSEYNEVGSFGIDKR
jgi:hypothetical protein